MGGGASARPPDLLEQQSLMIMVMSIVFVTHSILVKISIHTRTNLKSEKKEKRFLMNLFNFNSILCSVFLRHGEARKIYESCSAFFPLDCGSITVFHT